MLLFFGCPPPHEWVSSMQFHTTDMASSALNVCLCWSHTSVHACVREVMRCGMQGNCEGPPPTLESLNVTGVDFLELLPRQCVLVVGWRLTSFTVAGELWGDGIYYRFKKTPTVGRGAPPSTVASCLPMHSY